MNTAKHRRGHRLFFTQISAVDENCVEITKEGKIVATMNKRDRVIVKGYNSLILPKYIEVESNKLLDELPDEPFYEEITDDDVFANELDYIESLRNEIH